MIMIIVTCNKFYCDAQDKSLKLAGAERGAANVHKFDCDEEEKHFWRASQRHTNQDRYFGLLFKEEINYILIILVLIIIILYN